MHPGDLIAGLSVGLVVIPQSIAYAQVAGMPAANGLYAASLPSIAAAPFGSSRHLQTGPVGVTALLTFGALSSLATPASSRYVALALLLAVVVGVVRLAVGVLRLGSLAYMLSPPVLAGFMPAAALLIVISQVPSVAGVTSPPGDGIYSALRSTLAQPSGWSAVSIVLALTTVLLIIGGRRLSSLFPSIVLAVVAGIVFSKLTGYSGPTVGSFPAGLPPFSVDLPWSSLGSLVIPGFVIALLGFAEPAAIARTMAAQDRDRWDPNREFVGQGMANIVSGLTGGFPVGGSFSRTSLNRLAGAQTRWSGAVAGCVALAFLPFTFVLGPLPLAILGAIVIASVAALIRRTSLMKLWRISKPQATIATVTFAATLGFAPHVEYAVLLGVALSIGNHLGREYRLDLELISDGETVVLKPRGVLWFGSAQGLEDRALAFLADHPLARRLEIDLHGVGRVDVSGAFALQSLVTDAERAGLDVSVVGVPPRARRFVRALLGRDV